MEVFLVEVEQALARLIRKGFRPEGYDLSLAYDGLMGQSMPRQYRHALVMLAVMDRRC